MNGYEEIRKTINIYLMERFGYRRSFIYFTPDSIVTTRRNSRIDLYLRIRRVESLFPSDCLIIARIDFRKERIGQGSNFVGFLAEIALKYGYKYIGLESTNEKSRVFAEKLGFRSIDGSNDAVSVENLISFFSID